MKMHLILGICFIIAAISKPILASSGSWSYKGDTGPDHWSDEYDQCSGTRQSPINIPHASELVEEPKIGKLTFHGYENTSVQMTLMNNGHTAQVNIEGDVWIEGGGLPSKFIAAQFHFHWGSNDTVGSEHTLHGRRFPLEVHIVHYKEEYGSLDKAVDKHDGLAVLGFFAVTTPDDNMQFSKLTDNLHNIKNKEASHELTGASLKNFIPLYHDRLYRYQGSLTTPPCHESVTWSILTERLFISSAQLAKFRELYDTSSTDAHAEHLENNFRPGQSLNTRSVKINFANAGVSRNNMTMLNIVVAFLVIVNHIW